MAASLLVVLLAFASIGCKVVEGEGQLYVFGDSYVDTGNNAPGTPNISICWIPPYGITWPGYPFGRSSDGHAFSEFFASYLKVKTPVTFRSLNISNRVLAAEDISGINFAVGGSGAFSTQNPFAYNVSVQIQNLRTTINMGIVSSQDLAHSSSLLVVNGNDYNNFLQLHPDLAGITDFIPLVAAQIANDARELSDLGFKNIFISTLSPGGCLPSFTSLNNYSECIQVFNEFSAWHNSLLIEHISSLQEKIPSSSFQILDFYNAIEEILKSDIFMVPMKPCCEGITQEDFCGAVNENNEPQYTLCLERDKYLFWDNLHLTNAGYETLLSTLFPSSQYIQSTQILHANFSKAYFLL